MRRHQRRLQSMLPYPNDSEWRTWANAITIWVWKSFDTARNRTIRLNQRAYTQRFSGGFKWRTVISVSRHQWQLTSSSNTNKLLQPLKPPRKIANGRPKPSAQLCTYLFSCWVPAQTSHSTFPVSAASCPTPRIRIYRALNDSLDT